jgi:protein-S-isoprenylcysteine O-methyltransferase Ste14
MSLGEFVGSRSSNFLRLAMHGYSLVYILLAGACLISWRTPDLWSRFDLFSGGYLVLRTLGSAHSLVTSRKAFRSRQVMQEWWAVTSDPQGIQRTILLMLADLVVFVDYGHWHTLPTLERPVLQGMGLALYAVALGWQVWTDAHLARHFAGDHAQRGPMDQGPFRYVRHPRYAGAILAKCAFALVFASALGWLLALTWAILLLKKVSVEEQHLRHMFGNEYETYAQRTARLLPGVY